MQEINSFVASAIKEIDGWLSEQEGLEFYLIAKEKTSEGAIVEIGSWQGKSTVCIAKGIKDSGAQTRFYAIDPHIGSEEHHKDGEVNTFEEFTKNIKKFQVDDIVTPIVKFSYEAVEDVKEAVSFIFIDGAHDYESLKTDFLQWFPKMTEGGVVAFHDSEWTGVRKVLGEIVYPHKNIVDVRRVQGTTIFIKGEEASFASKMKKSLTWLGFEIPLRVKYFRRKLLGKPVVEYT